MTDVLATEPEQCLASLSELVAALSDEGIVPASIVVEWRYTDQPHPYLNVWLRYRTDLEKLARRMGLSDEERVHMVGQRHYFTKGAGPGPLLQAVSFPHHDDWKEPA